MKAASKLLIFTFLFNSPLAFSALPTAFQTYDVNSFLAVSCPSRSKARIGFEAYSNQLDSGKISFAAALSTLAYQSDQIVAQSTLKNWGLKNPVFIKNLKVGGEVMVADTPHAIFVTYTGSNSKEDWLENSKIEAVKDEYFGLILHKGFVESFKSTWPALLQEIKSRRAIRDRQNGKNFARPVYIFGHSLGGASAVLTAYALKVKEQIDVQNIITFGQPRVGNTDSAIAIGNALGHSYLRVINSTDPIPRVPVTHGSIDNYIAATKMTDNVNDYRNFLSKASYVHSASEVLRFENFDQKSKEQLSTQKIYNIREEEIAEDLSLDEAYWLAAKNEVADQHLSGLNATDVANHSIENYLCKTTFLDGIDFL